MSGIILVAVIALICGILLSVASVVFAVPVDETQVKIRAVLPGANCGVCGFSGCDGYAAALAAGTAEPGLCSPGGQEVAQQCAEILGKTAGEMVKKVALVNCFGTCENAGTKMNYVGVNTCQAASLMFAGDSTCAYGCLGKGDCAAACPEKAIIVHDGMAMIDQDRCVGCGICVKTCPKHIISLIPYGQKTHVLCSNTDKGPDAVKVCKVSCIGCMKCQKTCQHDAIHVVNFNAVIDYDKCVDCGECAAVCPRNAITKTAVKAEAQAPKAPEAPAAE